MATYPAIIIEEDILLFPIRIKTFSGIVKDADGNAAIREIVFYKETNATGANNEYLNTKSDSNGDFSIDIACGKNDKIRAICIGIEGENSQVFEDISGNF